jgi:RimJ/RimL family protein N-acetyltransferase
MTEAAKAVLIQHSYHEEQWKDRVMYRLLKSEWDARKAPL